MNTVYYYSKFCATCNGQLQQLSQSPSVQRESHFVCVDKRTVGSDGKMYVVLDNGHHILLPTNVTRVPALMLLNDHCQVLFGDQIMQYFQQKFQAERQRATQNHLEPVAFSFGAGGSAADIVSDQYSFLDQSPHDLDTTGNGGARQMHRYVGSNQSYMITDLTSGNIPGRDGGSGGAGGGGYAGHAAGPAGIGGGGGGGASMFEDSRRSSEDESKAIMEARIKKLQQERDQDMSFRSGPFAPRT